MLNDYRDSFEARIGESVQEQRLPHMVPIAKVLHRFVFAIQPYATRYVLNGQRDRPHPIVRVPMEPGIFIAAA